VGITFLSSEWYPSYIGQVYDAQDQPVGPAKLLKWRGRDVPVFTDMDELLQVTEAGLGFTVRIFPTEGESRLLPHGSTVELQPGALPLSETAFTIAPRVVEERPRRFPAPMPEMARAPSLGMLLLAMMENQRD
jgi:hypothetical protein